jgi:formylglycine-generating enzyme required for sulfatase activity
VLAFIFACIFTFAEADSKPADPRAVSSQSRTNCTECHQELAHGGPTGLFTKECEICHTSDSPPKLKTDSPEVTNHSHITAAQFAKDGDLKTLKPSLATDSTTHVDMYYDTSRIGEKPNEMVLVPAGEFTMGSNDRLPDEGPEHKVTLAEFSIDKYEVTNLQYKQFIDATNRKSPQHFRNRTFPEGKPDHPVTYVTWFDANDYCEWAGKRLPTEQEWEKTARGTDARTYPWGNDFDIAKANTPQRWTVLEKDGDTMPVGSFAEGVSPYGAYDMSGNVWEWTASWYNPHPGNTRITENYGEKYKVLKGGSWWDCTFYKCGISAPSYNRSFFLQSTKNKSFGFRCAKNGN